MSEIRPLPQAPIRSQVEHDNRVALRLNRAGSEQQNPICSGLPFRVKFAMSDAGESIAVARIVSYDADGNSVNSYDIKSQFVLDTENLLAYADLSAGTDTDSTADGIRNIITVGTSRKRWITQTLWVADIPSDIVLCDGLVTTVDQPKRITASEIPYTTTVSVSFFPSWNDEVGRQHYEGSVALGANVVKPYGGAKTVQALLSGIVDLTGEVDVEDLHSIPLTFGSDGQMQTVQFKFRAKRDSSEFVSGWAFIQADLCSAETVYTTVTAPGETIYLPCPPELDPPPDPPTEPDEITTSSSTNSTGDITVTVNSLGIDANGDPESTITLRLRGFKAAHRAYGTGTRAYAGEYVGYKETTVSSIGDHTIALDPELEDSDMVVVVAEGDSSGKISNPQIFRQGYTDVGEPNAPAVSLLNYSFGSGPSGADVITVLVSDAGWTGAEYYVAIIPLYAVIASGSTTAQDASDLGIDAGTTPSYYGPYTANHIINASFASPPDAAIVYVYNSLGASQSAHFAFDKNVTDYGIVKSGPTFSSVSLATTSATNDSLRFVVTDSGGNVGSLAVKYYVIPRSPASVATVKSPGTIPASAGTHTLKLSSGDADVDGQYIAWLEGEQGSSSSGIVSNLK